MKIQNIILIVFTFVLVGIFYKKYWVKASKDHSVLVVGTSADYPPYESIDIKTGQIVGFDIDILHEIANRLGKKLVLQDMPFATLIFALRAGEIDMIAAGMSPTPRRSKFVQFSDTYLDGDGFVIVTQKGKFEPKGLDDLVGKSVVVSSGHTAEAFMEKQKGVNLIRLKDVSLGLVSLQVGSADAFVCSGTVFRSILKKKNTIELAVFPLVGTGDTCAFALKLDNQKLGYEINKVLSEIKQDGTLEQLKDKWNI
jgi:ABC-type amino acid transport substrate-binding protein